jgi:spermidine synthase
MPSKKNLLISFAVFIAGLCSIVYELLISTTATYFLGNSVKQFSLIIGIYLFAMGIGAYLSKFFKGKSLKFFVKIEYLLGLIGGMSVPIMYFMFVTVSADNMQFFTWLLIFIIGLLTGMEVPLLTYAISNAKFEDSLANVLSLDYLGGLIATLIFPFILLPFIGLYYSSLLFGIVNIALGLFLTIRLFDKKRTALILGIIPIVLLLFLMISGDKLLNVWDMKIYKAPISLKEQTPHQLIVVTKKQEDIRLYLNRVIQFSSMDEHRYHEALVHPIMLSHHAPKRILVLGGGESLAAREILKHTDVEQIDVIDLDPAIFRLAQNNKDFQTINENAASDPKVNLINDDAFTFLGGNTKPYDIIISDLPDPNSEATAKLYTKQFFMLARRSLAPGGKFITQSGEIYFSNTAFSCIVNTMSEVFEAVVPLHTYVPSFGDWGFVIGTSDTEAFEVPSVTNDVSAKLKYLDTKTTHQLFNMPKDISIVDTRINSLDHPVILSYFLKDWKKWKPDLAGGGGI